jgi:hypothetical protein
MEMNWKKYPNTNPYKPDWYLVWVDAYSDVGDYADIEYWDGAKWKFIDSAISWWCEITPPTSND